MMRDLEAYGFLVENMTDGVYLVDLDRTITGWNKGAQTISGFSAEEVVGRACRDGILNHVSEAGRLLCGDGCPLAATMRDGKPRKAYVWMNRADGTRLPVRVQAVPIRDESGEIVGSMELFTDDTRMLKTQAHRRELERTNMIDQITGVGNREYLDIELASLHHKWSAHGWPFGVLVVEVDELESMADNYGEDVGERSLRFVADTLVQTLTTTAVVSYQGGYRFAALVLCADANELEKLAERIRRMVAVSRFMVDQQRIRLRASVGKAFIAEGDSAEEVLGRATYAVHQLREARPDDEPELKAA